MPELTERQATRLASRDAVRLALIILLGGLALLVRSLQATAPPDLQTAQVAATSPTAPSSTEAAPDDATDYLVTRVVDGDTFKASRGATTETVRLIGIDTPETVKPRAPVECFGREASARARELLNGQLVRLETDPTQDTRDRYGRLLAYAYLPDGTLVNEQLIAEGYAHEYTYRVPYLMQEPFRAAEREAREASRGLWSPAACPAS